MFTPFTFLPIENTQCFSINLLLPNQAKKEITYLSESHPGKPDPSEEGKEQNFLRLTQPKQSAPVKRCLKLPPVPENSHIGHLSLGFFLILKENGQLFRDRTAQAQTTPQTLKNI